MAARTKKTGQMSRRKPTRGEVAAAVFDWLNHIRSTLSALADTIEDTRREAQKIDSPLRDFLCHSELLELERDIANSICAAGVLLPDNPLGIHIATPLEAAKGGAL